MKVIRSLINLKYFVSRSECPMCRVKMEPEMYSVLTRNISQLLSSETSSIPNHHICSNKGNGCSWTGPEIDIPHHKETTCKFWRCGNIDRGCNWTGLKRFKLYHMEEDCKFYLCDNKARGCGWTGLKRSKPYHMREDCKF